jgi:glucose/arabinose dehydrogenase
MMKVQTIAVLLATGVLLAGLPAAVAAQQTNQSLADAARKAKAQQKQEPKAKIVWTNDNLPTTASVSVVGQTPQPANATSEAQPSANSGNEAPEDADSERAKTSAELVDAQKQLDSAKTDLDIAQRESKLDSDQYYSTPDYASDQQGKAKVDADKSEVEAKQQAVDEAQKKVDDLQKELDSLGTSAPKD